MYYLGRIESPSGVGRSNQQTGVSGALPFRVSSLSRIYLVPESTGVGWQMGAASGFQAGATIAAPLTVGVVNGPFRVAGELPVVSIVRVDGGGAVRVYAGPRS